MASWTTDVGRTFGKQSDRLFGLLSVFEVAFSLSCALVDEIWRFALYEEKILAP
jgi:hypothetical protein